MCLFYDELGFCSLVNYSLTKEIVRKAMIFKNRDDPFFHSID